MTGFWVHLNAQLTDPREPTAHAGKTPPQGRLAGAGAEIRALLKPTQDVEVQRNAQHKPTKIPTNTERGVWDIRASYLLPLLSMDIDEPGARSALCCGWLFLLGGFSVSGCFVSAAHFSHFSWHELPASTKLCIVLTDAEISPTEHTTSQVATSYEYFSYT